MGKTGRKNKTASKISLSLGGKTSPCGKNDKTLPIFSSSGIVAISVPNGLGSS